MERKREFSGPFKVVLSFFKMSLPIAGMLFVLRVPVYLRLEIFMEQYLAYTLYVLMFITFLTRPAYPQAAKGLPWYDLLLAMASLVVGGYVIIMYPQWVWNLGGITPVKLALGAFTLLAVMELLRRVVGWLLVGVVLFFFLYALFADVFPRPFHTFPTPLDRVTVYLFLHQNSLFGYLLWIGASICLAFILFGHLFQFFGGGELLTALALKLFGRFRGGPAKVCIVASAIFGGFSGSAAANVYVTGVVTIPLMMKVGYRPAFAGGVEASAATGGLIMPPIMGPQAFLMAELLVIPYAAVVKAAVIPAIMYYWSLFNQVDAEATALGLGTVPPEQIPQMPRRQFLGLLPLVVTPFIVLVFTIFVLYWDPAVCAMLAVLTIVFIGLVSPGKDKFRGVVNSLIDTGDSLIEIQITIAGAAFIIALLAVTGQATALAFNLVDIAGGNLGLLLVLAAVLALILGCGMPSLPVYAIEVILVAPALVAVGVLPIAAHLFVFYFGLMSMVTPPVALAAYCAATISRSSMLETAFEATRLSIVAYIVPFIFVFDPELLLYGELVNIIVVVATTAVGILLLAGSLRGAIMGRKLPPWQRVASVAVAGLLLWPHPMPRIAGAMLLGAFVVFYIVSRRIRLKGVAVVPKNGK